MELYHTSLDKIEKISRFGRFGSHLFFSCEPYFMHSKAENVYKIELSEDEIIDASALFFHEDAEKLSSIVQEVMEMANCDAETAEGLLDGSIWEQEVVDLSDENADFGWDLQKLTAEAAKILGFRAVAVRDEQGSAYMIDMLNKEHEMQIV